MNKLILIFLLCLFSGSASAQNNTCPDRPSTDSSNACANTRFVHSVSPSIASSGNVSSAQNGLITFGDSQTAGLGATETNPATNTCTSWSCLLYYNFVKNVGTYTNTAVSGISAGDVNALEFLTLNPQVSGNPIVTTMSGRNDIDSISNTAYQTTYKKLQAASYARPAIGAQDTIPGSSSQITTTGSWSTDVTYSNLLGRISTTNGSTACGSSLNVTSGVVYVYYGLYNGATVTGSSFNGYISGTTLTVTTPLTQGVGNVVAGQTVTGAGVTGGTTIVSGNFPTYTVSVSQTVGSSGSPVALSFSGGPYSSGGTFTVSIDGVVQTDTIGGASPLVSQPSPAWITDPGVPYFGRAVGLARFTTTPGTHNVCINVTSSTSASNPVAFLGFAIPPAGGQKGTASPKTFAGGVIRDLNDGNSTNTSTLNSLNRTAASILSGDGLNVNFVDVRSVTNTTLDMSGSATQNCPASTSPGAHPNDCGYAHMAQAFSSAINFSSASPIKQPLVLDNIPVPSDSVNGTNGAALGSFPSSTIASGTWCAVKFGSVCYGLTGTLYNSTYKTTVLTAGDSLSDGVAFSFAPANATAAQIQSGIKNFWNKNGSFVQGPFSMSSGGTGTLTPQAFASLAACSGGTEGSFAAINDSSVSVAGATITGGGGNHVLGYCNATNWVVAAQTSVGSGTTRQAMMWSATSGQASNTTMYYPCTGMGAPQSGVSFTQQPVPMAGSFKNLVGNVTVAPGAGQTVTYTLQVDGSDTALTCQIPQSGNNYACTDSTHTVSIAIGHTCNIKSVFSTTAAAAVVSGGVEFDNP